MNKMLVQIWVDLLATSGHPWEDQKPAGQTNATSAESGRELHLLPQVSIVHCNGLLPSNGIA